MGKRTNTARWTGKMWRIDVQQDGKRKSFYSSRPGRTGQREANAKADAWLDDGIAARAPKVADAGKLWLHEVEVTTCTTNYRPTESRWRNWILPAIGTLRVNKLTDQDLQEVINNAYTAGRSRKVLKLLAADMRAFCKYCRKAKLSAYIPEDLKIPAGARYKGKTILQPDDLVKLFNVDTTSYRGQTVQDEYINAYRFQVLTGLRLVNCWAWTGQTSTATRSTCAGQSTSSGKKRAARMKMRFARSSCPRWPGTSLRSSGKPPAALAACFTSSMSSSITAAGKHTAPPTV